VRLRDELRALRSPARFDFGSLPEGLVPPQ
jgi:hypothetical protein